MSSDIRKLIGRVYPVVQKFSGYVGRSTCGDELSPQDVAAAVGMAEEGLGRSLFLYLWWTETCDLAKLKDGLATALFHEWSTRELTLALISCDLSVAKADRDHERVEMLKLNMWAARKRCWRRCRWMYRRLVDVVLADLSHNEICDTCLGEYEDCERCAGHGVLKFSNTRRAEMLGVCRSSYRNSWQQPYEWLFKKCVQDEKKTASSVAKRLINGGR